MEEERQQILAKISRLRSKVERVPGFEALFKAARGLRMEQTRGFEIQERLQEQKLMLSSTEKKYESMSLALISIKVGCHH